MSLVLSKAISQLLLPPGGLILLGLLGLAFHKRAWGRGAIALSLICLWLLSVRPVHDALLWPLESKYAALQTDQLPAGMSAGGKAVIVLLGGGTYRNAPEYGGRDVLGNHSLMRTAYAAEVARKTGLDVFATGGASLSGEGDPVGLVMQRHLRMLGVARSKTHAENAADTTWENAVNMRSLLAGSGVEKVILVTTAWHMPRSLWAFESVGFHVIPAPCAFTVKQSSYDLLDYLPAWSTFAESGDALHEYMGLLWYRLRYGQDAQEYQ